MPGTPYETTNLTPEEITRLIAETLANMLVAGIRQQQIADRQLVLLIHLRLNVVDVAHKGQLQFYDQYL
jgi:hypothetical protein